MFFTEKEDMGFTVLVIGDPHLKIGALPRSQAMLNQIYEKIDERKPNMIVCLGDVLDRFAHIHQEPLSLAIEMFTRFQQKALTFILIGNHDRPNNSVYLTNEHPYTSVHHWKQTPYPINIIEKPYVHVDETTGYTFTFVPYTPEGRMHDALNTVSGWEFSNVVFSHQDIRGGKYNNITNTTGDVWQVDYPLLINGHIHDFQRINENIIFPGSPLQHAFNESFEKGLYWLEVERDFIRHERIMLDVPQLWTYHITYEEIETYQPPLLPEFSDMKLVIKGTVMQLKTLNKHPVVKKWIQRKIKIQQQVTSTLPATKIQHDYLQQQQPFSYLLKEVLSNDNDTKWLTNFL